VAGYVADTCHHGINEENIQKDGSIRGLIRGLGSDGKLTRNSKLLQNYSIFLTLAGTILELIPFVTEVFVARVGIIIAKMIKVGVGGDSISRWRGVGTVFGVGAFDVIVRPHGLENGGRSRGARPLDVTSGPFLEGEAGAAIPGSLKSCL
jgi:hypothetical protein